MKLALLLASLVFAGAAFAGPIDEEYSQRVCSAIYWAEGGPKARVPYGVLSIKTRSEADARRICLNSVKNAWDRWEKDGCRGDFIEFMGRRYCPVEGDKTGLNRNWVRNVKNRLNALKGSAVKPI